MARVFLALGSNLGNRVENMRAALRWLAPRCQVVAVSSLYRSEAVVLEGEEVGPDYLNAVCESTTSLPPEELLHHVKHVELDVGRRPAPRWAPRPIDIDILLYDDAVVDLPDLKIPHPLMAERNFVVAPLAELAPDVVHPLLQKTIGEIAEDVDFAGIEHVAGPEWAQGEVRGMSAGR